MSSELLQDYVEGRLGTVRQAEIAGLLLDDPEAAEQVMRLRQQGECVRRPAAANDERPAPEPQPEWAADDAGDAGKVPAPEPSATETKEAVVAAAAAGPLRDRLGLAGIIVAAFAAGAAMGWLFGT